MASKLYVVNATIIIFVLYFIVFYCFVLFCIVSYCFSLFRIVLYCIVSYFYSAQLHWLEAVGNGCSLLTSPTVPPMSKN